MTYNIATKKTLSLTEKQELEAFAKAMKKVLEEKGVWKKSWTDQSVELKELQTGLIKQAIHVMNDAIDDINNEQLPDPDTVQRRLLHLANYCMMIWSRLN